MVDADNSSFILQARTVVAPGNLSIATVFSAGAAKESNTSTVEVRAINESKSNTSFLSYKQCSAFFCPTRLLTVFFSRNSAGAIFLVTRLLLNSATAILPFCRLEVT